MRLKLQTTQFSACCSVGWAAIVFSLGCLQASPCVALNPQTALVQYGHTAWRSQEGAFIGSPVAVVQTSDGYIWIGTQVGLFRFDGVRYQKWEPPAGASLPNAAITSLLGSKDGSLYIGTAGGLARWKDGRFTTYGASQISIENMIELPNGKIWLTRAHLRASGPFCEVLETELKCYGKSAGINLDFAETLDRDANGFFWIGGTNSVIKWRDGVGEEIPIPELKRLGDIGAVGSVAVDADGSLWVGIAHSGKGMGLQHLVDGRMTPFVSGHFDSSSLTVDALFFDREGALWIGGTDGIHRLFKGHMDSYAAKDGLSSDLVFNFSEDREGNVWAATSGGLDKLRDLPVVSYSSIDGSLGSEGVQSAVPRHGGGIWVDNQSKVVALDAAVVTSVDPKQHAVGQQILGILEDDEGHLWIGIDDGLYVFEHDQFHAVTASDGARIGPIQSLAKDGHGGIWALAFGKNAALFEIHERVGRKIALPQFPYAYSLAADPKDGVWLGLYDGKFVRYRQGQFASFNFSEADEPVRAIVARADGVFGASGKGLRILQGDTASVLGQKNGLPCDDLRALVWDESDNLWLEATCGIFAIEKAELSRWLRQPASSIQFTAYGAFDGVSPPEYDVHQPSASRSQDGRLWFAVGHFLEMIDPADLPRNRIAPPLAIERIVADHKDYPLAGGIKLPALSRDIEVDYTALSFTAPQKVKFRYLLEGHDKEWIEAGSRRQAFYTDLEPRAYTFRVLASNNDGVWSPTDVSIQFEVLPAFYQTRWFIALCTASAVLAIWLLYRWRLWQIVSRVNARMQARLAERERIARDLHDTLLQGMQGLIYTLHAGMKKMPEQEPGRVMIQEALNRADTVLAEGRDQVVGLRGAIPPGSDLSALLGAAGEQLAKDRAAAFQATVVGQPRVLRAAIQEDVFRVITEAMNNAFQHASASHVELEERFDDTQVTIAVLDDGTGFDPKTTVSRPGHFGMQGMRERAKKIGGVLSVVAREGGGTQVLLRIPTQNAYERGPVRWWQMPWISWRHLADDL